MGRITSTWAGRTTWSPSSMTVSTIAAIYFNTARTFGGWKRYSEWVGSWSGWSQETVLPSYCDGCVARSMLDDRVCIEGFHCERRAGTGRKSRPVFTLEGERKGNQAAQLEGAGGTDPVGHVDQLVAVRLGRRRPGQPAQRRLDTKPQPVFGERKAENVVGTG